MEIIDIHAHIYPRVAGITKGAPMVSMSPGKVQIGNQITQFLQPSFTAAASTPEN